MTHNTANNLTEIVAKIESAIEDIVNGYPSQYFGIDHIDADGDDEMWTIRVADHNANPQRISDNTIIFVRDCGNRTEFNDVKNQIVLNDSNRNEWGETIEEILKDILKIK